MGKIRYTEDKKRRGERVEKEWFLSRLEALAQMSTTSDGVTRLAFTKQEQSAMNYIAREMEQLGLKVRRDAIGNLIGRMEGTESDLPAVAFGSHLDTVPQGGKYDGTIGVLAGLLVMKRLKKRLEPLSHPLELIVFAAEESSRFSQATLGSKAMAGLLNLHALSHSVDKSGISFLHALSESGGRFHELETCKRDAKELKAFLELHIEQGRILENYQEKIGLVEAIAAPTRLKITVEGEAAHSGATPMHERHDALVSAAMIVLAVQEIAQEQAAYGTVGTVGLLEVQPGAMNVVPGKVEMWVDFRGIDHDSIIESIQDLKDVITTIAEGQQTAITIEVISSDKPVEMDRSLRDLMEQQCRKAGLPYRSMSSGAGHDAMNMARLTKSGLIFIPCKQGISHNPEESISEEDFFIGLNILTQTIEQLAK